MVTLRVRNDVPALRKRLFIEELRTTLSTCRRQGFDVVHYSIQSDHFHLIVEADDHDQMGRGMMSLCIRIISGWVSGSPNRTLNSRVLGPLGVIIKPAYKTP